LVWVVVLVVVSLSVRRRLPRESVSFVGRNRLASIIKGDCPYLSTEAAYAVDGDLFHFGYLQLFDLTFYKHRQSKQWLLTADVGLEGPRWRPYDYL
jgi:hypothetical protein